MRRYWAAFREWLSATQRECEDLRRESALLRDTLDAVKRQMHEDRGRAGALAEAKDHEIASLKQQIDWYALTLNRRAVYDRTQPLADAPRKPAEPTPIPASMAARMMFQEYLRTSVQGPEYSTANKPTEDPNGA